MSRKKEPTYAECPICGEMFEQYRSTNVYCKDPDCQKLRANQRWAKWAEKDGSRERITEYQRKYRAQTNAGRKWEVRARYGLEWEDYLALLDTFNHSCALCGETADICVDHCHRTGKVRGILCRKHNAAIGALGDSADEVRKALDYLMMFETTEENYAE